MDGMQMRLKFFINSKSWFIKKVNWGNLMAMHVSYCIVQRLNLGDADGFPAKLESDVLINLFL